MKTSTVVFVGLGAAVALYLAMRPSSARAASVAARGKVPSAAEKAAIDLATKGATAVGNAILDWWNTPADTAPIDLTSPGDFQTLDGWLTP